MRIPTSFVSLITLVLVPHLARADFDPATGMVSLDDATFGLAFDGPSSFPEGLGVLIYDEQFNPITDLESLFVQGDRAGIEGLGALELGGDRSYMLLDLRSIAEPLRGRRVEIKLWQRVEGTEVNIELGWYTGDVDSALSGGDGRAYQHVGALPFQPSGRITDDGWQEWTTGPVDFSLAGAVDMTFLTFYDEHIQYAYRGLSTFDPTVRVSIDGLGIYDLGPAVVPAGDCSLLDEATACGPMGACQFGRCADAAAVVGPKLENLAVRDQYLSRRSFLFENLEGGRGPLATIGAFKSRIDSIRTETSNVRYWTGLDEAIDSLADGHASAPYPTYPIQVSTGICMYQGEADLLPGGGAAPLILETNTNAVGQLLQIGDALVAIDGAPVDQWRAAATRFLRYGGDPRGREFITTPQIMDAALMTGARLTFERCSVVDPSGGPCAPGDVQQVEVDLGAMTRGIYSGDLPAWRFDFQTCDYRFLRPLEDQGVRDYSYAGFVDTDDVRYLLINGVPSQYNEGGQAWFDTVGLALDGTGPTRSVLDERTGGGGSLDAVDLLASRYLGVSDFYTMDLIPQLSQPLDDELRNALRRCSTSAAQFGDCGNAYEWILGSFTVSGQGLAQSQKLAVLTGLDVSGNDFTSKLLTYRSGETRIFGAVPTYGAFGVIWSLPALAGELIGGSVQVQDTVFVQHPEDTNLDFNTGTGVSPDEVVLQKQSDAVNGIDTLLERARAWLAE